MRKTNVEDCVSAIDGKLRREACPAMVYIVGSGLLVEDSSGERMVQEVLNI
jgi:hypothetical protein